jgi:hypothetical protein
MLKTWKPLVGASLVAVLAAAGCFNFEDARTRCEANGRCFLPDGGKPCNPEGDDDAPDDNFRDRNCDGVDGMADGGLFVDPANGSNGATGTATDPLRTLGEALDKVRAGGAPRLVYLAKGSYNEPGLVLDTQVSLYGAYGGRGDWQRANENITQLNGGTVGLEIRGLSAVPDTVLDRLTITSANTTDAGMPSVALHVIDSQGIRLRYDTFIAGTGAPGATGSAGSLGFDGGAGGPGTNATLDSPGSFGRGGTSPCEGKGGEGQSGLAGNTATSFPGQMGQAGQPVGLGGSGGMAGEAGATTPGNPIICRAGSGGNGEPGMPGTAGMAGSSGMGPGELSDTHWVATQNGGNGDPGSAGGGGGGGGSGGTCKRETAVDVNGAAGGGSGGGGGGGCGGGPGAGGGGGGASIAVLLIRSDVHFEGNTVLSTRGGGRGGTGGEGGPGGVGGPGGPGGMGGINPTASYNSYGGDGGMGGTGGVGGPGGPGGGGGGGPSVGVWCGTDAGVSGSPTFQLADGGVGGTPATGGNPGQPGVSLPYQGCP